MTLFTSTPPSSSFSPSPSPLPSCIESLNFCRIVSDLPVSVLPLLDAPAYASEVERVNRKGILADLGAACVDWCISMCRFAQAIAFVTKASAWDACASRFRGTSDLIFIFSPPFVLRPPLSPEPNSSSLPCPGSGQKGVDIYVGLAVSSTINTHVFTTTLSHADICYDREGFYDAACLRPAPVPHETGFVMRECVIQVEIIFTHGCRMAVRQLHVIP